MMAFGRDGDRLILHGSRATRLLKTLGEGAPVCVTATIVDENSYEVLKTGVNTDGLTICPPMPNGPNGAFGGLTDNDARDISN